MKLITLGSGATGSSAVEDYLTGRGDVFLKTNREFRLIQDPGGLSDLQDAICGSFHMNRASAAITAFENLCDRLGRDKGRYPKGLNYRKIFTDYDRKCLDFIHRITRVSYPGLPAAERARLSAFGQRKFEFLRKRAKKRGEKPDMGRMRLPVTKELFYAAAAEFVESLYEDPRNPENKMPALLPQAGSFWAPVSSTVWFGEERKMILVTRDPRDILCDILDDGFAYPGRDIDTYVRWFSGMMEHVDQKEWNSDKVIHLKFEEFVQDYQRVKPWLDERLGLDPGINSSYDRDFSAKNIGKHKQILRKEEIEQIESSLRKYLHY